MINANDNGNTVIVANAIELIIASIIKINGGEKKLRGLDISKQRIADTVAARINSNITLTIGSKAYHA